MAHTPGPWEKEPEAGRGAWIKGANDEWAALACGDTDESARANAHLIAAAPDLLEALRVLLAYLPADEDAVDPQQHAALRAARAAIAKAECQP